MSPLNATPVSRYRRIGPMTWLALALPLLLVWLGLGPAATAEPGHAIAPPSPAVLAAAGGAERVEETIVFAGGCFWGVQAVFQHTHGVLSAVSGYAGGPPAAAHYTDVSGGNTGHAEAVEVRFDPRQVGYGQLLQIFFSVAHDPTQVNQQYPDVGSQYRSAIFYRDAGQQQVAQRYIAQLDAAKSFGKPIATQVLPLARFYPAEPYHQNYATLHPESSYIARYDAPKLGQLQRLFPALYQEAPVLVTP